MVLFIGEADRRPAAPRARLALRLAIAALYFSAGVLHLVAPDPFVRIMPDWAPQKHLVVLVTGLCEIAGALALLTRPLRRAAGVALALYALCVFPANIHHAFAQIAVAGIPDTWWYHGPRLLAQPVLIWATLFSAGLLSWPFRRAAGSRTGARLPGRPRS